MAAPPSPTGIEPQVAPSDTLAHKPIHSLVLDTGPLIKNDPPASVLIAKAEKLYTIPSVISEIRDPATRSRVETTLLPFITTRTPRPDSVKVIREFARKTGDLEVLSRPDLEVLALGYELELERNSGDWRLRNAPNQKRLNGRPGQDKAPEESAVDAVKSEEPAEDSSQTTVDTQDGTSHDQEQAAERSLAEDTENLTLNIAEEQATADEPTPEEIVTYELDEAKTDEGVVLEEEAESSANSDDEGDWITPSNLKKHQTQDAGNSRAPTQTVQRTLQAAVLTSDYAMQNVALRMNLNLVTPAFARITQLKNWVLRCHGCFKICKDMSKQFCPSCGQPTLNRVSCSTDEYGNFRVHLKKNFQWNNRGNVYSVPKPTHGSANGRLAKNVAGQGNWGASLILAEDQKEYVKATEEQRRAKKKDLMDDDFLPSILTGDRSGSGGKIRVGAGKRVNSKRKH